MWNTALLWIAVLFNVLFIGVGFLPLGKLKLSLIRLKNTSSNPIALPLNIALHVFMWECVVILQDEIWLFQLTRGNDMTDGWETAERHLSWFHKGP